MKVNTLDAKLAKTYQVHRKTIQRWREAGAPLNDEQRMRLWLATRKTAPPATTSRKRKTSRPAGDTPATSLSEGLPHALKRLEAAEASAYIRLESALTDGDPLATKLARDGWLRLADALRKADMSLEQARREAGELVSQTEVARTIAGLAYALRVAHAEAATQIAPLVSGVDIPGARTILKDRLASLTMSTLAAVAAMADRSTPGRGLAFPDWMLKPFTEDLGGQYRDVWEVVERRREVLVKAFRASVNP